MDIEAFLRALLNTACLAGLILIIANKSFVEKAFPFEGNPINILERPAPLKDFPTSEP